MPESLRQAKYPANFKPKTQFNPTLKDTWNIVRKKPGVKRDKTKSLQKVERWK